MTSLMPEFAARLVSAELIAAAETIDWADLDGASEGAERLLGTIADRLAEPFGGETDLAGVPAGGCALVDGGRPLWVSDRAEIAICTITPAGSSPVRSPHVHTRPITARVLHGTIRLALFGSAGPVLAEGHAAAPAPIARFLREDGAGRAITLHGDQGHLLEVDRPATMLVLRGPGATRMPRNPD